MFQVNKIWQPVKEAGVGKSGVRFRKQHSHIVVLVPIMEAALGNEVAAAQQMGGWLMVENCGGWLQKGCWGVELSGVEAVLRGGGEAELWAFMTKQECLCCLACLVWSDNKEHLPWPCREGGVFDVQSGRDNMRRGHILCGWNNFSCVLLSMCLYCLLLYLRKLPVNSQSPQPCLPITCSKCWWHLKPFSLHLQLLQ